jgi:hypothetical protein
VLEGRAVEKLHSDETLAVMFTDFIDGANVGVVQSRGSASFAAETLQSMRVTDEILGEELESDKAAKVGVFGLVDDAHAAAAQLFDDAVVRNGFADQEKAPNLVVHVMDDGYPKSTAAAID